MTAAIMNAHVRDNFNALAPTVAGAIAVGNGTDMTLQAVGASNAVPMADAACTIGWAWKQTAAVLIQDIETTSASAAITFSSIASGFRHLRVVGMARFSGGADVIAAQLNGDATTVYDSNRVNFSNATNFTETLAASGFRIVSINGGGGASDSWGSFTMEFNDYAEATAHKQTLQYYGFAAGSATTNIQFGLGTGRWRSSASITSIKLYPYSSTGASFVSGVKVSLYGM